MYYVDYFAMIASYLKPSLNSAYGVTRLQNEKKLLVQKENQNFIKTFFASICVLLCIAFVPEKPSNLASICQKNHSSVACQVW